MTENDLKVTAGRYDDLDRSTSSVNVELRDISARSVKVTVSKNDDGEGRRKINYRLRGTFVRSSDTSK